MKEDLTFGHRLEMERGTRPPRGLSVSFPHSSKKTELGAGGDELQWEGGLNDF